MTWAGPVENYIHTLALTETQKSIPFPLLNFLLLILIVHSLER